MVCTVELSLHGNPRTLRACSSKGQNVILGRIVSASGQIFRSDFHPQDEIFRPGMQFRPLDEQAPSVLIVYVRI